MFFRGVSKNIPKSLPGNKNRLSLQPRTRVGERRRDWKNILKNGFEVNKKNFKKVLVVWKKFFTFALANQDKMTEKKVLEKRTEHSSLT